MSENVDENASWFQLSFFLFIKANSLVKHWLFLNIEANSIFALFSTKICGNASFRSFLSPIFAQKRSFFFLSSFAHYFLRNMLCIFMFLCMYVDVLSEFVWCYFYNVERDEDVYLKLTCRGMWQPIRTLSNNHSENEIVYTLVVEEFNTTSNYSIVYSSIELANVTKVCSVCFGSSWNFLKINLH